MSKWEELTPNGKCRRLIRATPDAAMWVGYAGYCAIVTEPDGTRTETCFPSAFLGPHQLDCAYDVPGSGCRSVESAMASAEAAVRRRLEENVVAMGGRVVWGQEEATGDRPCADCPFKTAKPGDFVSVMTADAPKQVFVVQAVTDGEKPDVTILAPIPGNQNRMLRVPWGLYAIAGRKAEVGR